MLNYTLIFAIALCIYCSIVANAQAPAELVEPTQESLDSALYSSNKLTVIDQSSGKTIIDTTDAKDIQQVKECLRIKLDMLGSRQSYGRWIFRFHNRTEPSEIYIQPWKSLQKRSEPVEIYVQPWGIEWREWTFEAQLKSPEKLAAWLRRHHVCVLESSPAHKSVRKKKHSLTTKGI